jgi:hypothetical protein
MDCMSLMSWSSAAVLIFEPLSASCSLKRVRIVRRSWLTPVSIAVRCSICRSMRSRIWMKAKPARRTSSAPRGLKSRGIGRPLPKLSAASASFSIGRIWLRRKGMAMVRSTSDVPTIQTRKI